MKLAISTWGKEEKKAARDVINSGYLTMGKKVEAFEKDYADYVGAKYCVACNSGSSANLLIAAAMSVTFGTGEVIVPALGWSTSYSPWMQWGWVLKFVDIHPATFNIDPKMVREAFQGHELIMPINIMGNPCDLNFPGFMVEDNCESMGAEVNGRITGSNNKEKSILMSSHSTFFSHHIQTMEGGMVTTDDEYLYEVLLSLRSHGWTRHLPKNNKHEIEPQPFEFIYPGYNVRPTEIQGAIGIEQVKKLPDFIKQRRENANEFRKVAKKRGWQTQKQHGKSSWFGFIIVTEEIEELKKEFDKKGIEHRPVVGGNFVRSPAVMGRGDKKFFDFTVHKDLPVTDYVTQNGLYIGNNHQPIDWSKL